MRFFFVGLVLLAATLAWADSVPLVWDPVPGATAYDVERGSAASGPFTVLKADLLPAVCTGTPVLCHYEDTTALATATYFYRLVAKNATGKTTLTKAGIWYCGPCPETPTPPSLPTSIGVGK